MPGLTLPSLGSQSKLGSAAAPVLSSWKMLCYSSGQSQDIPLCAAPLCTALCEFEGICCPNFSTPHLWSLGVHSLGEGIRAASQGPCPRDWGNGRGEWGGHRARSSQLWL